MEHERLLHRLIVEQLRHRLNREYKEISVNSEGCPDLVLANHGLVLAQVQVETENSITEARAEQWKGMAQPGVKLVLMVPRHSKARVTDLLWQKGIADRVSLGSYEISIQMP